MMKQKEIILWLQNLTKKVANEPKENPREEIVKDSELVINKNNLAEIESESLTNKIKNMPEKVCPSCNSKFKTPKELQDHIDSQHPQEKSLSLISTANSSDWMLVSLSKSIFKETWRK